MKSHLMVFVFMIFTFFTSLVSCTSDTERLLNSISKQYIAEVGMQDKTALFISEHESDSSIRVFRISSIIFYKNQKISINAYQKIQSTWVFFSLHDTKKIIIPSYIINELHNDCYTEYDPIEWVVLYCVKSGVYRIIKDSGFKELNKIEEFKIIENQCLTN